MRVTRVSFVDWINDRCGRVTGGAVLPPQMSYWAPSEKAEEAPPVPEPDKGLFFDAFA